MRLLNLRRCSRLARSFSLLLLVHGLEVDFGQVHGRKASASDQVGHVATQVGVHDLGASDAHDGAHLVFGQIANFKNARLFAFHQKDRFVFNFGVHGGRDTNLVDAFSSLVGFHTQLNVDRRLLLLQQNGG